MLHLRLSLEKRDSIVKRKRCTLCKDILDSWLGKGPKKAPPKLRSFKNCMAFRMVVPTDVWNFFAVQSHCNFSYLLGNLCH